MGWRVRRNNFPEIIAALPDAIEDAIDDFAQDLSDTLNDRVWRDTGVLANTVEPIERKPFFVKIQVGIYLGRGFYSGFHEFGTVKMGARPVVVPTAHESEPIYANYMEKAVQRACRA